MVTIRVTRGSEAISIPADLARRALFLARLHNYSDVQSWLATVIRERIELEEAAYTTTKRELSQTIR